MTLLECFDAHGCDKGTSRHRYDRFYEPIFAPVRLAPLRILEIGIFKGASVAAWIAYFPNAEVIGVDTFERVKPQDVPILRHQRVSWWKLDSTQQVPDIQPVDIVIDDGSHKPHAQLATLGHYRPLLKAAGRYFIEDVIDLTSVPYATAHMGAAREFLLEVQ